MKWPDILDRIEAGEGARTEFNSFGLVFTEQQIVSAATASEIDMEAFQSFMRAQGKQTEDDPQPDTDDDLRNASVCADLDGVLRPTLYGLMVFGRGPQRYPRTLSLFVQCARYAGLDRAAEAVSVGEAKGRLEDQVNRAMGWFQSLGRGGGTKAPITTTCPSCRSTSSARPSGAVPRGPATR